MYEDKQQEKTNKNRTNLYTVHAEDWLTFKTFDRTGSSVPRCTVYYSFKKYKNDRTGNGCCRAASLSQQSDTEGHESSADHSSPFSKTRTVECAARGAEHTDLWSDSNHSGTLPAAHADIREG